MDTYYVWDYSGGFIKYANFNIYEEAYIFENPNFKVEMPVPNFTRLAIF